MNVLPHGKVYLGWGQGQERDQLLEVLGAEVPG
jgi:hypothetical protein